MKLLPDQNLSHRLIIPLNDAYPETSQVATFGMGNATDETIWCYARKNDYSIVTLDADFHECSLLKGGPPLIIWLKCGNQPRQVILEKLLTYQEEIKSAYASTDIGCLEIY